MHTNQLKYFLEVARQGSFSKASAALAVAQSAISRQVSNLENEIGTRLLYRDGRGATLTDAGQQFMRHCVTALKELELGKQAADDFGHIPMGSVIFCMPPSLTGLLARQVATRFHHAHPNVGLRLIEMISGHVQEWIMDNRVDGGILYEGKSAFNYPTELLFEEDLVLIASSKRRSSDSSIRSGSVEFEAACSLPLVLPGPTDGTRRSIDAAAHERGLTPCIEMEIDALGVIKHLVLEDNWYAILPATAVKDEIASGEMLGARINHPALQRRMVLGFANNRPLTPAVREFVRVLKSEVQLIAAQCPSIRLGTGMASDRIGCAA